MCLECSHHLYWTCSACWVWWSLCCHGCWWLLPWTGTSAEVSGLTEPHPLKGSKNTQLTISNWGKKLHLQFKMYIRTQCKTVHIKHLSGLLKGCTAIQLVTGRENFKASELDKWDGKPIRQEKRSRKAGKADQPSGTDQTSYLQTGEVSVEKIEKPLQNKSQIGFSEKNPWLWAGSLKSHLLKF